jgi:2',3'-cyclic-nucleotide 2'-phosphodiesterase (5'-nucleotidase family)
MKNHKHLQLLLLAPVFFTIFYSCQQKAKLSRIEDQHYVIVKDSIDSLSFKTIQPYKEKMKERMELKIGRSEAAFIKDQPEGSLGNLVCDILLNRLAGDDSLLKKEKVMVLLNNGGLRASIPEGEIKVSNIYELMPFDNEVVKIKMQGKKILELADYLSQKGGMPVAGCQLKIKGDKTIHFEIQGEKVDSTKSYWVISSDYLSNGGDKMDFFRNPIQTVRTGKLIRDEIIMYIKNYCIDGKTLKPYKDGRISISK